MKCITCKHLVFLRIKEDDLLSPVLNKKYKEFYYCEILRKEFYDKIPDIITCNKYQE